MRGSAGETFFHTLNLCYDKHNDLLSVITTKADAMLLIFMFRLHTQTADTVKQLDVLRAIMFNCSDSVNE